MDPSTFSARIWILAKTDVMWGKTVPFFTTYDWEWFIQTIKMVMTGGW